MSPSPLETDKVPEAGRCTIASREVNNLPIANRNKNSTESDSHQEYQTTVQSYEAKLDAAWGGRTWLPPPEYSRRKPTRGSKTSTIPEKALGYLVELAKVCQDVGIPVQTLYADGGLLFEAAVELHGSDPLRWTTDVPKKALELFNTSFTTKKVEESCQTVNDAMNPGPTEASTRHRSQQQRSALPPDNNPLHDEEEDHNSNNPRRSPARVESSPSMFDAQSDNKSADLDGQPVDNDAADDSADNRNVVDLEAETETDVGSTKASKNTSVTKELQEAINRLDSDRMLTDNCMDVLQNTILKAFPQSKIGIVHPLYFRPAANKLPHHLPRAFNGGRKAKFLASIHHNCHWVLAIFSIKEACIELWDPIPGSGALDTVKRAAVPWFEKMVSKSPVQISILTGPKQEDGVSCGAFVLLAIKHLLEGNETLDNLRTTGPEARATLSKLAHNEMSLCQNAKAADTPPSPTRKRRSMSEPDGPSPITKRRKAPASDATPKPCVQDSNSTADNSTGNGPATSISEIFASMEALGKPCDKSMSSATLEVQRHRESLQAAIQHREEVLNRLQILEQQSREIPVDFAGIEADRKRTRNWSEQMSVDGVRFRVPHDSSAMTIQKPPPALTQAEGDSSLTEESLLAARAELEMADVAIQSIKERLQDAEKRVHDHQIHADFWQMLNSCRGQM